MKLLQSGLAMAAFAALLASEGFAQTKVSDRELGNVRFQVSCSSAAQDRFHRAMALYHSFDWGRGKRAFEEIAQLDPRCGMAHWGLAMVYSDNPFGWPVSLKLKDGRDAIEKARATGAGTPRERDYIDALAELYRDHANTPHRPRALAAEGSGDKVRARVHYEKLAAVTSGSPGARAELKRVREQIASR